MTATTTRTASTHVPRSHYARLLITPFPDLRGEPIDRPTLLQLLLKVLGEWFGAAGGVTANEVDVVLIEKAAFPSSLPTVAGAGKATATEEAGELAAREVVIRFPRSATTPLLTALALAASTLYRIQVLSDSSELGRLGGVAGRGKSGYDAWTTGLLSGGKTAA
ncbi:hypothetical protein JCM21900_002108 [Sporobolomyces salmonicolor]